MAPSNAPALSSATFAKLSPHPFLLANIQPVDPSVPSARTNGRQPREARHFNINSSSLSHAHGSAMVRTGDTTVICGVRGETLLVSTIPNYRAPGDSSEATLNEARDYDLLVPNVELATGCAPNFLPGVPPTTLAQTLSTRVYSLLHSSKLIDSSKLRIYQKGESGGEDEDTDDKDSHDGMHAEGTHGTTLQSEVKAYWVLYIDVLFVSFDGNPFDAAWAAVLAALQDTKLPQAYWDVDREMVLCVSDGASKLTLTGSPVATTAAVFTAKEKQKKGGGRYWIIVDPDRLEESLCDETVSIVIDRREEDMKILGISKSGGTTVGAALMREVATLAESRWDDFRRASK